VSSIEGPKCRTREGGSEWEPIKILLEGDRDSNKMNTASNTRLRLNYPSWSRPRSHWSATDPRNQQTTFQAKTQQYTQRKLAQLAACATPVRPMACASRTDHVATGVLLILGSNKQPSKPKLNNTRSGNLHGLLPVPHRSDRWPASVRPVDRAG
jgi:hypothetical protein